MRVAVAMSGGVDSSVAAAILKEQGFEVIGVTMRLHSDEGAVKDAKQLADRLGVPHNVIDFREPFFQKVVAIFLKEYSLGRTPNPCINCNRFIKFDALLQKALDMGAELMATGHYARVESSAEGYRLLKGVDPGKDQSYFLYALGQEQLKHLLLPMGCLHKTGIKQLATKLGLSDIIRQESQDICFIPKGNHRRFIAEHITSSSGDMVDTRGEILGRHQGLARYTVGQRQGLGLASNERRYVLRLDAEGNRLVVGSRDELFTRWLRASQLSWISGKAPEDTSQITAKVRYKSPETAVSLCLYKNTAEVSFAQPQRAITPGQSIVFYQGETVLGGGIIESSS
jgi:tRNA-specific 2-thiouridylase